MLLQQEIRISDQGSRSYARATGCNLYIEQALFGYRINFENDKDATAPAQMVVVRNTIPVNLDLTPPNIEIF